MFNTIEKYIKSIKRMKENQDKLDLYHKIRNNRNKDKKIPSVIQNCRKEDL